MNIAPDGPRQSVRIEGCERTNNSAVGAALPQLPDGGAGVRRVGFPAALNPVEMAYRVLNPPAVLLP